MSPIHDQSYRRYGGSRAPLGSAWTVIAQTGIRTFLARKWFLALLLCAYLPFLGFTFYIYGVTMYPPAGQLVQPIDPTLFKKFFWWQDWFVFFVTTFVGSGLIADDRRANALQIYLSKPLMRLEYIGGKFAILAGVLLFITAVPGLLLVVMQVMFSGSLDFLRQNFHIVPAIILASLARVLVASFVMLAFSSLSKSSRFVAILYAGVLFFTEAIFGVLTVITGSTRVAWVSVGANITNLTDLMFRQPARYDAPAVVSIIVLVGLIIVSMSILERRVRGVEVVS